MFTCPLCGRTSHNPHDAAQKYCGHCHVFDDEVMAVYTITTNTKDYGQRFVVRVHRVIKGTTEPRADAEPLAVAETLEQARHALPDGLFNLGRDPQDDPVIVESWV